jgi:hypothetical protein
MSKFEKEKQRLQFQDSNHLCQLSMQCAKKGLEV